MLNSQKNTGSSFSRYLFAILFVAGLALLSGCAGVLGSRQPAPDWAIAQACAPYRPVDKPGMQRREAQQDAETLARRRLMNEIGRMRIDGKQTVNDVIARDTRLRARLLELVRTAEVYDWSVDEARGEVHVAVRLDRNKVRELFTPHE